MFQVVHQVQIYAIEGYRLKPKLKLALLSTICMKTFLCMALLIAIYTYESIERSKEIEAAKMVSLVDQAISRKTQAKCLIFA